MTSRRYLLQNSWGKDWGDGGFFGMPFEYMPQDAWIMPELLNVKPVPAQDTEDIFEGLINWAEEKYNLGTAQTQRFAQYVFREYNGIYIGLDTKRGEIVKHDGVMSDLGSLDFWVKKRNEQ
jgi:hypothetical protein